VHGASLRVIACSSPFFLVKVRLQIQANTTGAATGTALQLLTVAHTAFIVWC
jgi:hypothetical protein